MHVSKQSLVIARQRSRSVVGALIHACTSIALAGNNTHKLTLVLVSTVRTFLLFSVSHVVLSLSVQSMS